MPGVEYGLHKLITSRSENIFSFVLFTQDMEKDMEKYPTYLYGVPDCFTTKSKASDCKFWKFSCDTQSRNDPLSENNLQFCTEQLKHHAAVP